MPRFFIPAAEDAAEAESVLESVAKFVGRPVPRQRLFRVEYTHNRRHMVAEVGKNPDLYYRELGPIIAIFDGDPLLVCLPERGVVRGEPILVGASSVASKVYFDDEQTH